MKAITTVEQYLEKAAGFANMVAKHPWASTLGAGALGAGAGVAGTLGAQKYLQDTPPKPQGLGTEILTGMLTGFGSSAGKELTSATWKSGRRALSSGDPDETFRTVIRSDEMLAGANKKNLDSAFATMRRFAPSLASDPNAVQAFLREAVTAGSGVNYNTIKLLAEAEKAVNTSVG